MIDQPHGRQMKPLHLDITRSPGLRMEPVEWHFSPRSWSEPVDGTDRNQDPVG